VGPSLYFLDYLGALHKVNTGAHGYASYFALSLFDRFYHRDCSLEEGLDVIKKVLDELRTRFLLKIGNIKVKVANADGITEIDLPAQVGREQQESAAAAATAAAAPAGGK